MMMRIGLALALVAGFGVAACSSNNSPTDSGFLDACASVNSCGQDDQGSDTSDASGNDSGTDLDQADASVDAADDNQEEPDAGEPDGGADGEDAGTDDEVLPTGQHIWSFRVGDQGTQEAKAVATDSQGNIVVVGYVTGSVNFGDGVHTTTGNYDNDAFVAKYGPEGNFLWSVIGGDSASQIAQAVAVDHQDNIVVMGELDGYLNLGGDQLSAKSDKDVFLAKLGPDVTHRWSKNFGALAATLPGLSVAVDGDDNVITTGTIGQSTDFGGGALPFGGISDVFLAKFDPAGTHQWSHSYGVDGSEKPAGLAVDPSGKIAIVGEFALTFNFGGDDLVNQGGPDVFLAKFDTDGRHLWSTSFGATGKQNGVAVACDTEGNIVVGAKFINSINLGGDAFSNDPFGAMYDIAIGKFTPDGGHIWSKAYGLDSKNDSLNAMAVDGEGSAILSGSFWGTLDFGGATVDSPDSYKMYFAKLDADGAHLWSRVFGVSGDPQSRGLNTDLANQIVLVGRFNGTTNFGGQDLTTAADASDDLFVAKFKP